MAKNKLRRIGVLCSGGDSSGMNPCIRAVVRSALYYDLEPFGIKRGFQGLLEGEIEPMHARSVSNIISRGGTILKTSRCPEFLKKPGRAQGIAGLQTFGIEALVVIGGDGSFRGAHLLSQEWDGRVVGIPGTIDNDIEGTDFTIGYDTAVNVAVDALDKIRDTAASHDRLFFVEVMGRNSGYIALEAGISAGAEDILIPETPTDMDALSRDLLRGRGHGKTSSVVVVAEGDETGGAMTVAAEVEKRTGIKARVTILGHLQRGGSPTAFERVLASRLGLAAVRALRDGKDDVMVGVLQNRIAHSPLDKRERPRKPIPEELLELSRILAI
ncbi:MAG: 6-phosphofructokinase [Planctomycetota bacterium]